MSSSSTFPGKVGDAHTATDVPGVGQGWLEPGDHKPRPALLLRRDLDPGPANLCIRKTKARGAVEEHRLHTGGKVTAGAVSGVGMDGDAVQAARHRALPWFSSSQTAAQRVADALQDSTGVAEDG